MLGPCRFQLVPECSSLPVSWLAWSSSRFSLWIGIAALLSVCVQQGSLLVHASGLNTLDQTEKVLVSLRTSTRTIWVRQKTPLVL